MSERAQIAWLLRRVGFGPTPGMLDELEAIGVDGTLERLLEPSAHGVPADPDPWADLTFTAQPGDGSAITEERRAAVVAWIRSMRDAQRPLEAWMPWFWHGLLTSSMAVVERPALMVRQIRLLAAEGLGPMDQLLRSITVDAAMLIYLDGTTSRAGAPNENYGRELLELFSLGIGNYTEDDIAAAAVALTGWQVLPPDGAVVNRPRRHDDSPQRLLGVAGVHDVDSVIDAVVGHPACAPHIAGHVARAVLGSGATPAVVDPLAAAFAADGLALRPLLRSVLQAGLDGASGPMVWAPLPWFVAMVRATGAEVERAGQLLVDELVRAGQIPLNPPSVAGWPSGTAWLSSAVTIARANLAALIAATTPDGAEALDAAASARWDDLADLVGRPEGLTSATLGALDDLHPHDRDGRMALTVAMTAPEVVIA